MSFSSVPQTGPTFTKHPPAVDVFHPFPRLPPEIRNKIWSFYLADVTPQRYRFSLRYPVHEVHRSKSWTFPGDELFLVPTFTYNKNYDGPAAPLDFLKPLKESTNTRRIASATCVQSRQVVLELLPDTLSFRNIPIRRGWWVHMAEFPEYTLRFNGAKDIFVFHADWEDQEAAIHISGFRGSPPDSFSRIRHVGIAVDRFTNEHLPQIRIPSHFLPTYGTGHCPCTTEQCQDCCKQEPLPEFLSLFPLLKKFYVAKVPIKSKHQPLDQIPPFPAPEYVICPCPEGSKHSWQMIRSTDACGWFVIYDERSPCPFPKIKRVENLRRLWRPHFPYYQALNHLEILFIQPWDPETCSDSPLCNSACILFSMSFERDCSFILAGGSNTYSEIEAESVIESHQGGFGQKTRIHTSYPLLYSLSL